MAVLYHDARCPSSSSGEVRCRRKEHQIAGVKEVKVRDVTTGYNFIAKRLQNLEHNMQVSFVHLE